MEDNVLLNGTVRAANAIKRFSDSNGNLDLDWLINELKLTLDNTQSLYDGIKNTRRPAHSVAYDALMIVMNREDQLSSRQVQAGFKHLGLDYKEVLKPVVEYVEELRADEELEESVETPEEVVEEEIIEEEDTILEEAELEEVKDIEVPEELNDLCEYMYDYCEHVKDYIPDYDHITAYYDSEVTEENYNKAKEIVEKLVDSIKYYNDLIELNDNHTVFDLKVEIDDEDYWFQAHQALEDLEQVIGTDVYAEGRMGRHICVDNTFANAKRYQEFCKAQREAEKNLVDSINGESKEEPVTESIEKIKIYQMNEEPDDNFRIYFKAENNDLYCDMFGTMYECTPSGEPIAPVEDESIFVKEELVEESYDEYKNVLTIDFLGKIFTQMRKMGWDGSDETLDKYFDAVIDQLKDTDEKQLQDDEEVVLEGYRFASEPKSLIELIKSTLDLDNDGLEKQVAGELDKAITIMDDYPEQAKGIIKLICDKLLSSDEDSVRATKRCLLNAIMESRKVTESRDRVRETLGKFIYDLTTEKDFEKYGYTAWSGNEPQMTGAGVEVYEVYRNGYSEYSLDDIKEAVLRKYPELRVYGSSPRAIWFTKGDKVQESDDNKHLSLVTIYQIKDGEEYRYKRFEPADSVAEIDLNDYDSVATFEYEFKNDGNIEDDLEGLFRYCNGKEFHERFPMARSLSVSDLILVDDKYYYTDYIGFEDLTARLSKVESLTEEYDPMEGKGTDIATDLVDLMQELDQYDFNDNYSTEEEALDDTLSSLSTAEGRKSLIEILEYHLSNNEDIDETAQQLRRMIERVKELDAEMNDIEGDEQASTFEIGSDDEELKTAYDLIQDRIGQDMSVGQFNTVMQSIFAQYNEVFLLTSDLYNMDVEQPQEVIIFDDDDMYTITFNIKDIENAIIEITDVKVD